VLVGVELTVADLQSAKRLQNRRNNITFLKRAPLAHQKFRQRHAMNSQQTLADLFAQHHDAIQRTLTQPARFEPWIIRSSILLSFTRAHREIAAGRTPDRADLLARAVREAIKLRRMANHTPRRIG
jgi:hypothetical protein